MYIFDEFELMEMAKRKNEKYPWLSWIPYAKEYLRGKMAYNINVDATVFLCANITVSVISFSIGLILVITGEYINEQTIGFIIPYILIIIISIGFSVYYITLQCTNCINNLVENI